MYVRCTLVSQPVRDMQRQQQDLMWIAALDDVHQSMTRSSECSARGTATCQTSILSHYHNLHLHFFAVMNLTGRVINQEHKNNVTDGRGGYALAKFKSLVCHYVLL